MRMADTVQNSIRSHRLLSAKDNTGLPDAGDIVPVSNALIAALKRLAPSSDSANQARRAAFNLALKSGYVTRSTARYWFECWQDQIIKEPDGPAWQAIVEDERIAWTPIKDAIELSPAETPLPVLGAGATNWATADGLLLAPAPDVILEQEIGSKLQVQLRG